MLLFPNGVGACDILNVLNYVSYSNISNPGWHHVWWTSMSRAQYPEQLPARYITFHWCSRTLSFLRPYVSLFKLLILVTNFDWNKCEMSINKYELFFHCAVQRSWRLFGTLLGGWKSEVPNFGPKKVPILLVSPKCRPCMIKSYAPKFDFNDFPLFTEQFYLV